MANSLTIENLNAKWSQIEAKQGLIGKAWNGVKEVTNLGQSASDCESMLEKYKNHEITFDEAIEYIENFEKKQSNMTDLIANIATGIGSIALATTAMVTAGATSIPWLLAFQKGAPIGALLKTSLKILDRATNDVKNDAMDCKMLAKDAISGAVTGTVSAVSSGVYAGVKNAKLSTSVINGTKCGLECGALAGAASYVTDTTFDKDKKFNFGELTKNAATSALVSGSVGAFVGGSVYGVENALGNVGHEAALSLHGTIVRDSFLSSSRKVLGNAEKQAISQV